MVITNDGKAQMADAKTTKGNVAHAIIEALFALVMTLVIQSRKRLLNVFKTNMKKHIPRFLKPRVLYYIDRKQVVRETAS